MSVKDNKTGMDTSIITLAHYKVHDKTLFNVSKIFTNTAHNTSTEIYIKVGANDLHLAGTVGKIGAGEIYLIREASASADGTTITAYNRNQNGTDNNMETEFFYTPTNATGTTINQTLLPGSTGKNQPISADARTNEEWELKPNTNYIIRITNLAGSTTSIGYSLDVYET